MEITGKIKLINDTQEFSNFKKRDFVIVTDEKYPQTVLLEAVQDKCSFLDKFKPGDNVKVGLNIRGREWTSPQGEVKYFNTLQVWRIDQVGAAAPAAQEDDDLGLPF